MSMFTYVVSKEEALKALTGAELDIAVNTLVHVPLIRNAHRTSKVEYKITIPGEDPSKYVVADGTQRVEKLKDSAISLTVSAVAMPETALRATAANEYLESSQFVQSQDYRVKEHAQRATAGESNPARAALRMEKYVHDKLKSKNFSTALASAAEVAESMEGDCTEHAVLLAAMLRAQQIPSRIAVGLVYVERQSCFGGHMWTEAKIGETWVPLDATLGRGGIGAAHIKLVESSFSDEGAAPVTAFLPLLNVLGNIQIEVVSQQ
jgi:transglutaminase-like putative cysteine protease